MDSALEVETIIVASLTRQMLDMPRRSRGPSEDVRLTEYEEGILSGKIPIRAIIQHHGYSANTGRNAKSIVGWRNNFLDAR